MSTTNAIVQRTSQEATRCVEQNDPNMTRIFIHLSTVNCPYKGSVNLGNDIVIQNNTEFINLGKSIGNNTCLERVALCGCDERLPGAATTRQFMNGFKRSTSIKGISFMPFSFSRGLGNELLNFYQIIMSVLNIFSSRIALCHIKDLLPLSILSNRVGI